MQCAEPLPLTTPDDLWTAPIPPSIPEVREKGLSEKMAHNLSTLPPELRRSVLLFLIEVCVNAPKSTHYTSPGLAPYAAVCREWQEVIERNTFSSLYLCLDKLDEFEKYVHGARRRRVRQIVVHIKAPEYSCDPCVQKETFDDKRRINDVFTRTLTRLFSLMHEWTPDEIIPGGIRMNMTVSSPSDLRNVNLQLWQKRRWNNRDIGERRFADSVVDFVGSDDVRRVVDVLKPVYAITCFVSEGLNRRAVMPAAYAEIISALPNVREVYLNLMKDRRVLVRKRNFRQFGDLTIRWPQSLEKLVIRGNTISNWRQLPHAAIAEGDSGEYVSQCLQDFAAGLRSLAIANLVSIRSFFTSLWPENEDDRDIVPAKASTMTRCPVLETVDLAYSSLLYKIDWYKENRDFNYHGKINEFRQELALAASRFAIHMPALQSFTLRQRPMMWAGRHELTYTVEEKHAVLLFSSSFDFEPAAWVVEAWTVVAKKCARKPLEVRNQRLVSYNPDGQQPMLPSPAF
ncbi:hypothetical protein jhhlp_004583 [Lomentospora prolificans]|uniref:DUF6546 domain-containing protein n=1 Tax=Lomentospora prolificans TaxID=41688 RepID=A0A2N3NBZ6_9PEZI|nr:hypothetical protein jhhlp_004583 [Lomentospora prolificans]